MEIQASLWIAQKFSAKTTQSTLQKLELQLQEVARFTCATKNPELGAFYFDKQMNHKTCLKIFTFFFFFLFVFCMLKIWAYLSYKQTGPLHSNNPCERPTSQDPPLSYTSETHAWLSRPAQKKDSSCWPSAPASLLTRHVYWLSASSPHSFHTPNEHATSLSRAITSRKQRKKQKQRRLPGFQNKIKTQMMMSWCLR